MGSLFTQCSGLIATKQNKKATLRKSCAETVSFSELYWGHGSNDIIVLFSAAVDGKEGLKNWLG